MNHLLDADLDPLQNSAPDREISLGAATILGIFFALALVCAAFFGFGYRLGRKSAQGAADAALLEASSAQPIMVKPAAGSQVSEPPAPSAEPVAAQPLPVSVPEVKSGATPADGAIVGDKLPPAGAKTVAATPAIMPPSATLPAGSFMVQIAAVSTQEIADIELTALKKYGYDVVVRHEPQDQLLHIQVGPYATRKEAETMKQNILAHGFNAIVK